MQMYPAALGALKVVATRTLQTKMVCHQHVLVEYARRMQVV
jgi:hypothetical protein